MDFKGFLIKNKTTHFSFDKNIEMNDGKICNFRLGLWIEAKNDTRGSFILDYHEKNG